MHHINIIIIILIFTQTYGSIKAEGLLYPRDSKTRNSISLNGIWNFVAEPPNELDLGFRKQWYKIGLSKIPNVDVLLMPVPSSYNDITQDPNIRDHAGSVWYERAFFAPESWSNNQSRILLRFSSVHYGATVWINGELAMRHQIGHLPFQKEINSLLKFGESNRLTVECSNNLSDYSVPQGGVSTHKTDQGKRYVQQYDFDFFNYAGIDRPVILHTTPWDYIDDITIRTVVKGSTGIVLYDVIYKGSEDLKCVITLLDKDGTEVAKNKGQKKGLLEVSSPNLWWPYLMDNNPAYLYTLQVELFSKAGDLLDVYTQPFGIRMISTTNTSLLINNRPLYLHGFGRHEDADIRGKGVDLPTIIRDHNLIKWVGGNTYRTSHYPYCDEILDVADQLGIMIIAECPSVKAHKFSSRLLQTHKDSLTQLIRRDKNRPSVIMWSIANEPISKDKEAGPYFKEISEHVRTLDETRPITMSIFRGAEGDKAAQYLDVVSFNVYYGWYVNTGELDMITDGVISIAEAFHRNYGKPVLISEYGADTVEGLHYTPAIVWSEEYQVSLMSKHFQAFDILRRKGWFIGEFIWNFADFKTAQGIRRVGGNKKGIFTRSRQPKAAAHHLRRRYFSLAQELYNITAPNDIDLYILDNKHHHDEL